MPEPSPTRDGFVTLTPHSRSWAITTASPCRHGDRATRRGDAAVTGHGDAEIVVTVEYLVPETATEAKSPSPGLDAAASAGNLVDSQKFPAWSRDDPVEVTDVDGVDEHRADAVAVALLAAPPPRPPGSPDDAPPPPPRPSTARCGQLVPGPGRPLPGTLRRWAESVTAVNLSDVRLHDDRVAHEHAHLLGARAFTTGTDIVLGEAIATVDSGPGLATLAHEIGHVVAPPADGRVGRDNIAPGTGEPHVKAWHMFFPDNDLDAVRANLPDFLPRLMDISWSQNTLDAVWDDAAKKADAPTKVLSPLLIQIVTENYVVTLDDQAALFAVDARDPKKFTTGVGGMRLVDQSTGVIFAIGVATLDANTQMWMLRPHAKIKPLAGATPGQSVLMVLLTGLYLTDEQVAGLRRELEAQAKAAHESADEKGRQGWAKDQVAKLKRVKAMKAARQGEHDGIKPGGRGKGDTGEGRGAGHGKGDGIGDGEKSGDSSSQSTDTGKAGGEHRGTRGSGPLQGPVQYDTWVNTKGDQLLAIGQDRAWTAIKLKDGESTEDLEKRADEALQKLQDSRDPDKSKRIVNGVNATGFVQPKGDTEGVAQTQAKAEAQAKSTPTAATPGERIPGAKGGANSPAYPAIMTMAGNQKDAPATTVSGATNEFTMDLDYAALSYGTQDEVFNRLQDVQFYWEVIDVSGLTREKALAYAKATKVGEGTQETGLGAIGTTFKRDMKAIGEDQSADVKMMSDEDWPWEARAQYLTVIGISNVVRMLGSIIGSFLDTVTEPLNARSIGFDEDGDYIIRCVATPQVSDDARADPAHHVIRASSVAVLPVRVQEIKTRALTAVDLEEHELDAKRAAYEKAVKDGSSDSKVKVLKEDLDAATKTASLSGYEALQANVKQLEQAIHVAEKLKGHLDNHVTDEDWDPEEIHLRISLLQTKTRVEDFLEQRRAALKALRGDDDKNLTFAADRLKEYIEVGGVKEFRPRMVLASEETGQVSDILCMLGQISPEGVTPVRWRLADVTTESTHDYYTGTSNLPGAAGRNAAIRDAFRNFAENADYGRGTLAIRLPSNLINAPGGPVSIDEAMVSRPGPKGRFMNRLKDIAKVAMVVGVFATGPLGLAIGAIGGIAGAIVAVDSLVKRARTGHLVEIGTVFDVLGVIGGVASVLSVGTYFARAAAEEAAQATGTLPKWIKGLERTEKALHVHAQIGMVQQVVTIPIELALEWSAIENDHTLTEEQANKRKLRALLHAAESGLLLVAQVSGSSRGNAEEPGVAKDDESLPAGAGADDAQKRVEGSGPQKPPSREAPAAEDGTTKPEESAPPPKKSVADKVEEARALAQKQVARKPAADEELEPEETGDRRTARGTPQGGETGQPKPEPVANAKARERVVEELAARMGADRQIKPAKNVTPPKRGSYGSRTKSSEEALATYDKAVTESGGREVGLYFNANTGEFQVQVGSEHEVSGPGGDGWQAVVHLHPNPENVTTFRLPAPADIAGAIRSAVRTGSHTEYVQSHMPDGSSGMTKVTVTLGKPPKIVVEMPASAGIPARRIEVSSAEAYAKEYGEETTYLDPSSPEGQWVMRDLDDFYANRDEGSNTARGTAKRTGKAAGKDVPEENDADLFADRETIDDRPRPNETPKEVTSRRITNLRRRLRDMRDRATTKAMKKIYEEDLAEVDNLKKRSGKEDVTIELDNIDEHIRAERKAMTPVPVDRVRALAQRARNRASKKGLSDDAKNELLDIAKQADELASRMEKDPNNGGRATYDLLAREIKTMNRQDYEIVVPLLDESVRTQVIDWIESRSAKVQEDPVGQVLMERILEHLKTADALTLKQSPRQSEEGSVKNTDEMRSDVMEAMRSAVKLRYFPEEYCTAFEEASRKYEEDQDEWPRDPTGKVWEVDHIAELWLGGADDITNYLAIPKAVHDLKTDLFKRFRDDWRAGRVVDDQTDSRETKGL